MININPFSSQSLGLKQNKKNQYFERNLFVCFKNITVNRFYYLSVNKIRCRYRKKYIKKTKKTLYELTCLIPGSRHYITFRNTI